MWEPQLGVCVRWHEMQSRLFTLADDEAPVKLTWQPIAHEQEVIAVLDAAPEPHETIELAFRRKEYELRAVFARLTLADARALHRRLTLCLHGDPIAARFVRLIGERRNRLLDFLAAARRREAVRHAR